MTEKIVGYLLLGIGIFLIIISAISVYQVFTGQRKPVQVFQLSGISLDIGSQIAASQPSLNLSPEIMKALKMAETPTTTAPISNPTEIIPAALINDSSNLFIHLLLMGFIASVGQKFASLGVQLVRPIVVKVSGKGDFPAEK